MTNGWTDIRNADVILAMGGNPAENHPVGFRFVMEARRNRNAKLVSVDPRFNRTSAVADSFTQIRVGTDIAFLGGLIHYALSKNRYHEDYVRAFTNAPFLLKDTYSFDAEKGLFSGWDAERKAYTDVSSWGYELDERGFAKTDPSMTHPRSVFQAMKVFYARYTPEMVSTICGCTPDAFNAAADLITSTYTADRAGTIMYALGWTHHSHSVQLIHAAAMLQLLLGNIGRPGGGINALRGHANIQGGTDNGVAYHNLPGLHPDPEGGSRNDRAVPRRGDAEAAERSVHELLGQHRSLLRQPAEGVLRHACDARQRLRVSACTRGCRRRRRAATRTGAGPTSSIACTAATWTGSSASA